ncbi:S8 family serine peptidase [Gottfriedia sp. NPDC057991]|uniref:S8 family serine peptidase n=1 Tax=Gottfriedia sp. NPDC057991 TaxID=3346298 RepID=UPI0036DF2B6C
MGSKNQKNKIVTGLTTFALSTSFILASFGHVTTVSKAATSTNTEDILSKLTSEQRQALRQLTSNNQTGLQLPEDFDLNSTNQKSVIVEFVNQPAKVAQIEASVEGESLSATEASNLVDQDHTTFQQDLPEVLTDDKDQAVDYTIQRSYKNAFNGVSISLPANQIQNLLKSKAVKAVWSNETVSIDPPAKSEDNDQLKADEAAVANYTPYDGLDRLHKEGYTGKGIKIGILDTGIDYNHPDLKNAYKGGYDFVDNDNDPMETTYADWKKSGQAELSSSGEPYYTEHGTHVAGIIGGRGVADSEYKQVGAAPEADLYAYRVLGPYGSGNTDAILGGIDRAVKDGMDVVNMSLGSSLNDPLYVESIAVDNAVLNGVTMVIAAGNSGDKMFTLGTPGTAALPITVGASSVAIDITQYQATQNNQPYILRQLTKNYTDDLTTLKGKTFQLVDVGLASPTDFTNKNLTGKFAYIQRGTVGLADKVKNAKAAGAIGVLMANNIDNQSEGAIQSFLGESMDAVPAFSVSYSDGLAISAAMKTGVTDFTLGDYSKVSTASDELATFSSRGPSRVNYDIKPEVVAPGVSIMSTVPFYINNKTADGKNPADYKTAYARLSGTSMATPYVAGVAALLLQSNKDLSPTDVKSILMNTADPLSKDYSVFEVGSGRVDAYEAIHSNVQLTVNDKTPLIVNGKQKDINEETGGMSFGSIGFDDKDIADSRTVTLKIRSEKAKTFNVNVKFQTGRRDSKDAAKNNVTLSGSSSIKLNGISQKSMKFALNIPKTAEKGTYEGYVVFTNAADPAEQYQIPFGVRVVTEGIDSFNLLNPIYSTQSKNYPIMDANMTLKSYMKTLDIVLQDAATGEDIGFVGTMDARAFNENTTYLLSKVLTGGYYPFTGDAKNPISSLPVNLPQGHYKLRLLGTSESGKHFAVAKDFMNEFAPPNVTTSFDSLDQKVIEYSDSQLDATGKYLYDFSLNVNDPEIEDAKRFGIPADQSRNYWGGLAFRTPIFPRPVGPNGDVHEQLLIDSKNAFWPFSLFGMDPAQNQSDQIRVVFTKNTTPYYYAKANKKEVTTGDTVNYTVRSNNTKNLKTSKITMTVNNGQGVIENVKVNDAVKAYGDATVTVQTAPRGTSSTTYTVTFTYTGDKTLPEDMDLFNYDLKVGDKSWFAAGNPVTTTATTTNQSNVVTSNANIYVEYFNYKPTISYLTGYLKLEGTVDPVTGTTSSKIDQRTIGAKVTMTSDDGKTVLQIPIIGKSGDYLMDGVKAQDYTMKVDVPGHFTVNQSVKPYVEIRGVKTGANYVVYKDTFQQAAAGDTNKDNVIDILDALYVQTYWGTNNPSADFNFDKKVDANDMNYVVKNFGLKNNTVPNAPNAKKIYKGTTLDSILAQLGMK